MSNKAKQYLQDYCKNYLTPANKTGYVCPSCQNGTGDSGDGITLYEDGTKWKCFKCGKSGDIYDLYRLTHDCTQADAFKGVNSIYHIENDYTPVNVTQAPSQPEKPRMTEQERTYNLNLMRAAMLNDKRLEYMASRGLNAETANRFLVGYIEGYGVTATNPGHDVLIIPDNLLDEENPGFTVRGTEPGSNFKGRSEHTIKDVFNKKDLATTGKPIFITEGSMDAMSIYQAGGVAIALQGTANNHLFKAIEEFKPSMPLLLALDSDQAGQQGQTKLLQDLKEKAPGVYAIPLKDLYPQGIKDANEWLQKDGTGMEKAINELNKKYNSNAYDQANRVDLDKERFLKVINDSQKQKPHSTGFTILDNNLDGGLYAGLYGIGAISSLGKTTFVMQVADYIAEQGQDVLIFSLEMSKEELYAKSISRLTMHKAQYVDHDTRNAKTARQILAGYKWVANEDGQGGYNVHELDAIIYPSINEYFNNVHRFIIQGDGQTSIATIREELEKFTKIHEKPPVVVVDYLQLLQPADPHHTDKQAVDFNVLGLKQLSRDYSTPVIIVSSFNRENYKNQAKMESFKESGAIEYSTDVLIGLQLHGVESKTFDVNKAKQETPRNIELVILKNRYGRTGTKIKFFYDPRFNDFREVEEIKDHEINEGDTIAAKELNY